MCYIRNEGGGRGEGSPKTTVTVTSLLNCWLHIFWCESNTRWGPDKRTCYVSRYSNLNETWIKVELRFAGRIKAHLRCGNSKFHGEVAPRDVIIFVLGCIKRIYPVEKRKVSRARNNWAHCRLTMNISLNYSTPIFGSRISNVSFHFFFSFIKKKKKGEKKKKLVENNYLNLALNVIFYKYWRNFF